MQQILPTLVRLILEWKNLEGQEPISNNQWKKTSLALQPLFLSLNRAKTWKIVYWIKSAFVRTTDKFFTWRVSLLNHSRHRSGEQKHFQVRQMRELRILTRANAYPFDGHRWPTCSIQNPFGKILNNEKGFFFTSLSFPNYLHSFDKSLLHSAVS